MRQGVGLLHRIDRARENLKVNGGWRNVQLETIDKQ